MSPEQPLDIDAIRLETERFRAILELEKFDLFQDQAPQRGRSELAADFAPLTSRESISAVSAARAEAQARAGGDDEARRLTRLRAWLVQAFSDHEVRDIDEQIARAAHGSTIMGPDGVLHPLRDARLLLAKAADPQVRATLEEARVQAAKALVPLLAERLGICHGVARSLGCDSFLELWSDSLHIDIESLRSLAESVLTGTDDMYREVMGWTVRKRLGCALEDARRCDIPFVFSARYADYEDAYETRDMVLHVRAFLERAGLKLDSDGRLSVVINQAPHHPHRAFACAPRIPHDVRVVIQGAGSQRDFQPLLNAVGRSLFLANISEAAPLEDRILGDGALDLTYGRIFQDLPLDRAWLKRVLNLTRPRDYSILAWLERLYEVRLACARVLYELELYSQGTTEGQRDRFAQIFSRALVVETPSDLFLHEVRRPFLSAPQLRSQVFTALYDLHMQHYFNADWWQNPRVGPFLRKEWAEGRRVGVEARASALGYSELTVRPLLKHLTQRL